VAEVGDDDYESLFVLGGRRRRGTYSVFICLSYARAGLPD